MTWLRQWLCGQRGHTVTLEQTKTRMWLKCQSCGLESAGWDVPRLITPPRWKRVLRFKKRLAV